MSEFLELAEQLSLDVVKEVKESLGGDYEALTAEQQASIKDTAVRVIDLRLRLKAGEDVADKLQAVESTVKDWKVWGQIGADVAFWKGVKVVAETLGTFLAGAAKGFIPGL